jgi:hypothetical protein
VPHDPAPFRGMAFPHCVAPASSGRLHSMEEDEMAGDSVTSLSPLLCGRTARYVISGPFPFAMPRLSRTQTIHRRKTTSRRSQRERVTDGESMPRICTP